MRQGWLYPRRYRAIALFLGILLLACVFSVAGMFRQARGDGPVLLDEAGGTNRVNQGHLARTDGVLLWSGSYFGVGEPMDWTPYDTLEVTLYNRGTKVIPFTFEVKDRGSTSYWTRVNQPQALGPGLQIIRLPTRLRVGEPARPGRPLDRSNVTSLILSRSDDTDHVPERRQDAGATEYGVEVRRIELKKAGRMDAPPGSLAFDVGPEDTPVFDGFQALTEKTDYAPERGWGWTEKKLWSPYGQVNRLFGPERLTSDNLTIASGKLRFDVKPGRYRVWMILDHPGGFWGEFPYFRHRTVRVGGRPVIDDRETPREAQSRYFAWADSEDREGDDLFEKYWAVILKERSFEARVDQSGHLEVELANEGCPGRISCFGIALSALAILPINSAGERAAADRWLEKVHERRRQEFHDQFKEGSRALSRLLNAMPAGLQARAVAPGLDLSLARPEDATSFRTDAGARARVTAFRNARAVFAPLVSWKAARGQAVSWRVEGLAPGIPVEGGWIKFRALRDSYTGNVYSIRERWVTDARERDFLAQDLGRVWLRFQVAADARPGVYPATLVVRGLSSGDTLRIPFELRVLRGVAADLDFPVGPFGSRIQENWWDGDFLRARLLALEWQSLKKLRSLGMTSFSFSPRIGVAFQADQLTLDTREVDRVMVLARKLGFQALVGYDAIFEGAGVCGADSRSPLADPVKFRKMTEALELRAQERSWLPLALVLCDEPAGKELPALLQRLRALNLAEAGKTGGARRDSRISWSVTTSLSKQSSADDRELVSRVDLPFLQGFLKPDVQYPWAYYNDTSRRTLGLGLLGLRETTDLRYRMSWAWNVNSANPFFALDGREDDIAWCSSLEDASLRCTVELDRVIDAGVTDYRIALALKRTLAARAGAKDASSLLGQKLLDEARGPEVDPEAWRSKVGEYLENL